MEHFFRLVLLYAVILVPLHFVEVDDKFVIEVCAMIGVTAAYGVAMLIFKTLKKKQHKNSEQKTE